MTPFLCRWGINPPAIKWVVRDYTVVQELERVFPEVVAGVEMREFHPAQSRRRGIVQMAVFCDKCLKRCSAYRGEKKQEGTFFFSFLHLPLNSGCCFTHGSLAESLGGPSSGSLYSCIKAGTSRREEKALQSQEGPGRTRTAFVWPQQLHEIIWVQIPTLRGQAHASGSLISDGCTHRAAALAWLLFHLRVWVRRTVCGNSLVIPGLQGLCEQWALQEKEGSGLFF